jgi:small GTP-binding protein
MAKHQFKIAFFGRTGVGKTSTINALFNLKWKVEHGKAATKEQVKELVNIQVKGDSFQVLVIDTPGFAESTSADYAMCHQDAAKEADCLFWIYQADVRYFSADQKALINLKPVLHPKSTFLIGLNHIDLIHPQNWDSKANIPSSEQMSNIPIKSSIILDKLQKYLPHQLVPVIPYSAKKGYNLGLILDMFSSMHKGLTNV